MPPLPSSGVTGTVIRTTSVKIRLYERHARRFRTVGRGKTVYLFRTGGPVLSVWELHSNGDGTFLRWRVRVEPVSDTVQRERDREVGARDGVAKDAVVVGFSGDPVGKIHALLTSEPLNDTRLLQYAQDEGGMLSRHALSLRVLEALSIRRGTNVNSAHPTQLSFETGNEAFVGESPGAYGDSRRYWNLVLADDSASYTVMEVFADGEIRVDEKEGPGVKIYVANRAGFRDLVGAYEENEHGLIQLPGSLAYDNPDFGTKFGFRLKEGHAYRSYISKEAFAALLGALMVTNTEDLGVVGFSEENGGSPSPSKSHINGINGDIRYLRKDFSGGPLHLNLEPDKLDADRQDALNEALFLFGWKDMLSYRYRLNGVSTLPARSRMIDNNHHHHLHIQRFNPNITQI